MTTPITIKKKEVIASLSERRIKEELKKKDFYKVFFDKIKDKEICEGDIVTLKYSVELTYAVSTNMIISKIEEDVK